MSKPGTLMLSRKNPMARGKGFAPRAAGLKSNAFARTEKKEKAASSKAARGMKPKGMKGRTPTAEEAHFMDVMGKQPCLACAKDGIENSHISLHHIDGRTKPGAHFLVISLCAPHHQRDDSDPMGRISVHGSKKRFAARYGTERELLAEAVAKMKSERPTDCESTGPSSQKQSTGKDSTMNILPSSGQALAADEAQS